MSTQSMGFPGVSFKADADLSAYQYYCVKAASVQDYVKLGTGGSDPTPMGVLQDNNGGTVGNAVNVCMIGPCLAKVAACDQGGEACPIGHWDALVCASGGQFMRAGSNSAVNAYSMQTLTTGSALLSIWYMGPNSSCSVAAS